MNAFWPLLVIVAIAVADDQKASTTSTHIPHSNPEVKHISEDPLLHLGFAWKDVSAWTEQAARDVKAEFDKVDVAPVEYWLDRAGKDIAQWSRRVSKDVKHKLDKIEVTAVNGWIHQAASDVQAALGGMNTTDFGLWVAQASKDIGLDQTLGDLQYARLEDLPYAALQ